MSVSIARKNLFSDRVRFLITVFGVTVSIALICATVGMYLGFMQNASFIIDNTGADIWVTSKNCKNFDFSFPFPKNKRNKVQEVKGVAETQHLLLAFALIKLKSGGTTNIEVLGVDPDKSLFRIPKLKEGRASDLKKGRTMIVDESSKGDIGDFVLGEKREVLNRSVKIVGISEGIKTFIQAPLAVTSLTTAYAVTPWMKDQTVFVLVKVKNGYDKQEVLSQIRKIPNIDAFTSEEFSYKTKMYWTKETAMGIAFSFVAGIGLLVGMVIVGQTIYASTLENLREFGTLKAIGGSNMDILKIIIEQAFWIATIGYALGMALTAVFKNIYERQQLAMVLPEKFLMVMFFVTLAMCMSSSFISVRKATSVDPMMVFKT